MSQKMGMKLMTAKRSRQELDADWTVFGQFETAALVLETFLIIAADSIAETVFDPIELRLPIGARMEGWSPEERPGRSRRKARPLEVTEEAVDLRSAEGRRLFSRLAYSSALATVWDLHRDELFESTDYGFASYYLPESTVGPFLTAIRDRGIKPPAEWRTSR